MVLQRSQVIERNWFRLDGWMLAPQEKRFWCDTSVEPSQGIGGTSCCFSSDRKWSKYIIYIYTIFFTWCLDIVQYSKLLTQSLLLLVFVWSGSPFSNATTGRGKTFDDFQMPRFRRSVAENRRELLTGIQSHCQRKKEVRSEVSPKSDT